MPGTHWGWNEQICGGVPGKTVHSCQHPATQPVRARVIRPVGQGVAGLSLGYAAGIAQECRGCGEHRMAPLVGAIGLVRPPAAIGLLAREQLPKDVR